MLKKFLALFLVVGLVISVLGACSSTTKTDDKKADAPTGYEPKKLTIGFVPSQNAETLEARAKPLAELLSKEIGIPVDVKVTTDYNSVVEAMGSKQLDLGFLPPNDYVIAHKKGYADVLLQALRYGVDEKTGENTKDLVDYYKSEIIVLNDSPIKTLEDLKGKKIAWQAPTSSAGYVWPAVEMKAKGLDAQKDVTGVQLQGHDKGVLAILNKDVDAAAIFMDARNVVKKDFPDVFSKTRTLYVTDNIPNDTISVHPDMTKEWQDKISAAFEKISKDPEGLKIVTAIYSHVGYKKSTDANFDIVRQYGDKVKEIGK